MKPLRGVIIGMGGVARQAHLPAYRAVAAAGGRLEVVGGIDVRQAGTTVDGIPVLAGREDVARLGPIDFLDICTPTDSHFELALWGLDQGYHVLCEKPVALTPDEAATLVATARRAGRVLMPCHQHRYNPAWRQLRAWVESGAIGRWHLAEFDIHRPAADPGQMSAAVPWRGRASSSRGGVLLDHGTHLLYLLRDLAGDPRALHAWTGRLRHADYDVEDSAELLLDFGDRAARLFLTWAGATRESRIRLVGERGQVEWRGGRLVLEAADGTQALDFTAQLDKASYADWFASLFRDFSAAVSARDGAGHLADLAGVAEILALAYRSAAEGRRLTLEPVR